MKIYTSLCAALCAVIAACGGGSKSNPTQPPTGSVVFEGDSLSALTVSTWPTTVRAKSSLNTRWYPVGISATRTDQMVARYASNVAPHRPLDGLGVFFINGGTNDIIRQTATPAEAYVNLKYLWATARSDGFKVIAFTIHSVTHRTVPCATCTADMAELNRLILSDSSLYDRVIRMDQLFPDMHDTAVLYDKLHFTVAGNARVADAVLAVLGEIL